ncbi:MAG TPA: nuclear transport factor 2 family protein [Steroidobacteraceae bacterium]|nr:nuclear transport factor 2 family protein [Steroidobacteraceae bacterium]
MDLKSRREIETECVALSHAFAYHLDHKNYEELAALFVPRGAFIRTGVRLVGHAQILATLRQRPAEQFTRHVTTNFHFTRVEESMATGVFYNLSYFAFTAQSTPLPFDPQRVMVLDFLDTFVKTADGWRFLEREARPMMIPEELRSRLPPQALVAHTLQR